MERREEMQDRQQKEQFEAVCSEDSEQSTKSVRSPENGRPGIPRKMRQALKTHQHDKVEYCTELEEREIMTNPDTHGEKHREKYPGD